MSKSNKYVIATSHTENSNEFKKTAAYLFMSDFPSCDIDIHYQNKRGLPAVYNQYLTKEYRDYNIIFMHDDIYIHDRYIHEKVTTGLNKYNIVGLAGCKRIAKKDAPAAWHLMSDRADYVGEVAHTHENKIWTTVFGSTDSEALIIDGLFIGVNIESILDKNIMFDEDFSFHHYDMSFCLRARSAGATIGVMQLFCIHQGLGDSMFSQEWKDSSVVFKKKYI